MLQLMTNRCSIDKQKQTQINTVHPHNWLLMNLDNASFLRFRIIETKMCKNSMYSKTGYHQTLKEYRKVELENLVYETVTT